MITYAQLGRMGRLGNQFFEVASTIGIATANNQPWGFPGWYCDYTKKDMQKFFKNPLPELPANLAFSRYTEKQFHYEPITLDPGMNHDLHGYFQSEKYWAHCREKVLHYFEPAVRPPMSPCCSIHVRRGDYVNNKAHAVCDMSYYVRAIDFIINKTGCTSFKVFSDDIEWCMKMFPSHFIFVQNGLTGEGDPSIHRENATDVEEMFQMAACKHNIISNSSYSWWSAYLGRNPDRKIVAPARWFGEYNENDKDVYTPNMIKL